MPSTSPHDDLLARLKSGERDALRQLFEAQYERVCQAIYRLVPDRSTSEDLAQEVFLRFWDKRERITITSSLPAYLRRMAINEALGYLRRQKRWEQDEPSLDTLAGTEASAEEQYLDAELKAQLNTAINELPPKCRAVFQLSRHEGLAYKEIAEQMGISIKTVENQMGKALRVLRQRMSGYLNVMIALLCLAAMPAPYPSSATAARTEKTAKQKINALEIGVCPEADHPITGN